MIKAVVLSLGVILSSQAVANCDFINQLSLYQRVIAQKAYFAGKPYDLGITAVAVAWQESKLGVYKVRFSNGIDKSVGIGHSIIYYKTKGMSGFDRGRWMQEMIQDDDKSISVMIQDLLYWKAHTDSWKAMVGSYNGGWKPNAGYYKDVAATVNRIKQCKWRD